MSLPCPPCPRLSISATVAPTALCSPPPPPPSPLPALRASRHTHTLAARPRRIPLTPAGPGRAGRYNGSSVFPDGAAYVGEWRGGAPHGRGVMTSRQAGGPRLPPRCSAPWQWFPA